MLADVRTARMDMLISKLVSLWKANFLALLGKLALRGRNSLGDRELLDLLIECWLERQAPRGSVRSGDETLCAPKIDFG
jgi:hypothetical protein